MWPLMWPGCCGRILLADQDRLFEIADFAELVRQRSEVSAGILVELLFELVDAGGTGHQSLGGGAQAAVVRSGIRYLRGGDKSIRSATVT